VITGNIYGNNQLLCGGVQSPQWLVTAYKERESARPAAAANILSRAIVAISSNWLAFHISALATARTALRLPGSFRRKLASARSTCTQTALTVSRLCHASPHTLNGAMTHLLPIHVLSWFSDHPGSHQLIGRYCFSLLQRPFHPQNVPVLIKFASHLAKSSDRLKTEALMQSVGGRVRLCDASDDSVDILVGDRLKQCRI